MSPRLPTLAALLAMLALAGCAHDGDGAKGRLVSVTGSADAVGKAFAGRRLALVVGINEVADDRWRKLRFATKDATDLAGVLLDPTLGAYDSVAVLTSREQTTRDALRAAVRTLAQKATRPEDIVVLYVSAHGTLARDAKGALRRYLVTSDADFHAIAESALPVDELSTLLEAAGSRRRVIILATCHSGSGKSLLPAEVEAELASVKGPPLRALEETSRASIVLSASDFGETAREDEELRNDVYTHFLVEALSGAGDRNGDGAVTATEAHDFARRKTWVFSQGRQRPSAEIVEVGADPVILSGSLKRAGQPELFSYAPRLDGFTLKVDGETRAELPGGVAVPSGGHKVELTKGEEVLVSDELTLSSGQRLDLESLVLQHEPNTALSLIGGGFSFVDQKSRSELLNPAPSVGLAVRFEHVWLKHLSFEADVSGFGGAQALSLSGGPPIPFTYGALQVGGSALISWDWKWGSVWVGPRVAVLVVNRSFTLDAYQGTQTAWSVTPGVLAGVAYRLAPRWELSVSLETMLTVLTVDGQAQVLGFVGGFAGVGYRL